MSIQYYNDLSNLYRIGIKGALLCVLCGLMSLSTMYGQIDTIAFKNGDILVGELKELSQGVATFETDYSDKDFKLSWLDVVSVQTSSHYLISLSNGKSYNGYIKMRDQRQCYILEDDGRKLDVQVREIVFLKAVKSGFWSRMSANIEIGLSISKSRNLRQFTSRSSLGYAADRWYGEAYYNSLTSTQSDTDPIDQQDGGLAWSYILKNNWYIPLSLSFNSNTELNLKLRTLSQLGFGKYFIRSNKALWGVNIGVNSNIEKYDDSTMDRESFEASLGTQLNLFDMGDLSLNTNAFLYPSLSEVGRWRADMSLDFKYDFPLDFYIKFGYTLNYDNRPVGGAEEFLYNFVTTVGWEL